ncbi:aminoacyl-histidine dipeptidase [Marinomonas sp. S3726]|uniref:aminoacyl-histidine dipeptidase n=1 Tax=Marinomonas sp. S3726 TaxID=579484 RepID=UPI0005FA1654|nr:aminoacyl-histidine dipeptidase [Marinomonas sp. S3726]KJZ10388.1 aminoacyl-histidine dipeptidase [Marinomonas sp. S3726]
MNQYLEDLEPKIVWKHFRTLCDTPRPSFHEAQLRNNLIEWSHARGLETYVDPCGNLIIRKNASPGMEGKATVVLQGHLDMVAQKNAGVEHDFVKDPIATHIVEGWVTAKNTTLGADNGIGVAAALAVLETDDIQHGPIEALFTIEEETSLRGALELEEGILEGRLLLNLDSEDRGDVYIGCAGGVDINIDQTFNAQATSSDDHAFELSVKGLKGGHSGLDIHKGRASANVLLSKLLVKLNDANLISIAGFNGGTLRNAIAREAVASVCVAPENIEQVKALVKQVEQQMQLEFAAIETKLNLNLVEIETPKFVMNQAEQKAIINALISAPHGVNRMSTELEGVTETSCNFGVIDLKLEQDKFAFSACLLVRSLIDEAVFDLARVAQAVFEQIGANVSLENDYPGWRPDPSAGLLAHFLQVHKDIMGYEANVKVIHAGLECGIIGAKYQGMEMVSFGPNIRGAHSPDERLEIDSVNDFWRLLVSVLAQVPNK